MDVIEVMDLRKNSSINKINKYKKKILHTKKLNMSEN